MLDGVAPTRWRPEPGFLARAFKPREQTFDGLSEYFTNAYRHWGRMFFSPLIVSCWCCCRWRGLVVFAYLVARVTEPRWSSRTGCSSAAPCFIVGRFLLVSFHELAHGLTLAHYGRRTGRAGFRLLFIFPYAFVDSSEAYFETRVHRIGIAPRDRCPTFRWRGVLDPVRGRPTGNVSEVLFQLAFAGTLARSSTSTRSWTATATRSLSSGCASPTQGACSAAASTRLSARARKRAHRSDRYAMAGLVWSVIGAGFMCHVVSLLPQLQSAPTAS